MAITIKHKNRKADESATPSGTQGAGMLLYGPPSSGRPFCKGLYHPSVAGASGTYVEVDEVATPGVASPNGYTWSGY